MKQRFIKLLALSALATQVGITESCYAEESLFNKAILSNVCRSLSLESANQGLKCSRIGTTLLKQNYSTGDFIIRLCDEFSDGGIFSKDFRYSCLTSASRNSTDKKLSSIFKSCSAAVLRSGSVETGKECFLDRYSRL